MPIVGAALAAVAEQLEQQQEQVQEIEVQAERAHDRLLGRGVGAVGLVVHVLDGLGVVRGQAHDFDDWAANGNDGWSFKDVLPYFRKLESHPLGDSEYHGASGPIRISPMKGHTHPICDAFLKGCGELGYPRSEDFNGEHFEGAGIYDVNTRDGQRCSSSFAYLHPALGRPNLHIEHHALAERILFLDGLPNFQLLGRLHIGENVEEILKADLELELEALTQLRGAIGHCEKVKDYVSRDLFSEILANEEEHVDTLEQQFEMIARMGIQNYVQLQSEAAESD